MTQSKNCQRFAEHADRVLGLKVNYRPDMDPAISDWASAALMRGDEPSKWRLWFETANSGSSGVDRSAEQIGDTVRICWYVGPKFYSHKMPLENFLKLSRPQMHEIARIVAGYNSAHQVLTERLKRMTVELKEVVKAMTR